MIAENKLGQPVPQSRLELGIISQTKKKLSWTKNRGFLE